MMEFASFREVASNEKVYLYPKVLHRAGYVPYNKALKGFKGVSLG